MINCYAFGSVPPFAKGLVRDLRVRWALEEAGLPYRVTLVGDGDGQMARSGYRFVQPFGQIPAIEDDGLTLFESGAIVLYVAERSRALLRKIRPAARTWCSGCSPRSTPSKSRSSVDERFVDRHRRRSHGNEQFRLVRARH